MINDIKPVFLWAKARGDANICDRVLVKIIPQLVKNNIKLTSEKIEKSETLNVSQEIYDLVLKTAENLVEEKYHKE